MSKAYARRTSKTDPKGDRRSRTISHPPVPGPAESALIAQQHLQSAEAVDALSYLLNRGDGWLRMTAPLDGKSVYLKYKYTSGKHRGCYVMAVATFDQLAWAACLLAHKTRQADTGEVLPSPDTFYDWRE